MRIAPTDEKSLNEILGLRTPPVLEAPPLAHRLFETGSVPLRSLEDAQLALLLRHGRGATHLLPIALDRLDDDIWNDGGLYAGHLLVSALRSRGRLGHLRELEQHLLHTGRLALSRLRELNEVDRRTVMECPEIMNLTADT